MRCAGIYHYWKRFEIHAVVRVLAISTPGSVIDFGAGHSVYETEDLFQRAEAALKPFHNIVLLLPTENPEESIATLRARFIREPDEDESTLESVMAINEHFVRHRSNQRLARLVVYTKDKTPEETCAEIAAWVKKNQSAGRADAGKTPTKN